MRKKRTNIKIMEYIKVMQNDNPVPVKQTLAMCAGVTFFICIAVSYTLVVYFCITYSNCQEEKFKAASPRYEETKREYERAKREYQYVRDSIAVATRRVRRQKSE